jgi:hypothetical protein
MVYNGIYQTITGVQIMFNNTQAVADRLITNIDSLESIDKKTRRGLFDALHRFESCGWHSEAFADAMQQVGASFDGETFTFEGDVSASIGNLISIYLGHMGQAEEDYFVDIFDMHEASTYLGIAYDTMKTYVSRRRLLRGKEVGKGMIFTRPQLDKFKAMMPSLDKRRVSSSE